MELPLEVTDKNFFCDAHRKAEEIPWGSVGADYVCESTGVFTDIKGVSSRVIMTVVIITEFQITNK